MLYDCCSHKISLKTQNLKSYSSTLFTPAHQILDCSLILRESEVYHSPKTNPKAYQNEQIEFC